MSKTKIICQIQSAYLLFTQILSARLLCYLQDFVTLYQNFNEKGLALVAFPWSATQHPLLCFDPMPVVLPTLACMLLPGSCLLLLGMTSHCCSHCFDHLILHCPQGSSSGLVVDCDLSSCMLDSWAPQCRKCLKQPEHEPAQTLNPFSCNPCL